MDHWEGFLEIVAKEFYFKELDSVRKWTCLYTVGECVHWHKVSE